MAFGNDVVVIVKAPLTAIVRVRSCVSDRFNASVTSTLKIEVAVVVGVPEIVPPELRVRFIGSDPKIIFQLSGGAPPVAVNVKV